MGGVSVQQGPNYGQQGAIFHLRALNCKNSNLQRTDNIFAAHETFLFINILILYRNLPRLQSYQSVCTWYCNTPSLLCKKWSRLHRKVSLIKTGFTNSKTGSWENFKFSKSHFRISHLLISVLLQRSVFCINRTFLQPDFDGNISGFRQKSIGFSI